MHSVTPAQIFEAFGFGQFIDNRVFVVTDREHPWFNTFVAPTDHDQSGGHVLAQIGEDDRPATCPQHFFADQVEIYRTPD